ncbi:MAG: hypothetical protein DCC75_06345 [Proteobacteria bacterium]|nr:MAG: hypothetical protein DCC75_06345 [Pseudomonadota bacterium]
MAFEVSDPLTRQIGGSGSKLSLELNSPDKVREKLNADESPPEDPDLDAVETSPNIVDPVLDTFERATAVAETAITEITYLRTQQRDLAERASEIAYGSELTRLSEEFETLQENITSIASTSTFRGQNVLSGSTYYSGELGIDFNPSSAVIGIPSADSATSDPGLSLSSVSNAVTARDTLLSLTPAISKLAQSYESANQGISGVIESLQPPGKAADFAAKPEIRSIEEAEVVAGKLAREIGNQIGSPFSKEQAASKIIEISAAGLDPERVRGLLE